MTDEFAESVRRRAGELGLEIVSLGVKDVILPGEMKDLLNRVLRARRPPRQT